MSAYVTEKFSLGKALTAVNNQEIYMIKIFLIMDILAFIWQKYVDSFILKL